jgi:hypothetical protein
MKPIIFIVCTMLLSSASAQISIEPPLRPTPGMTNSGPKNITISPVSLQPLELDLNEDGIKDISFSSSLINSADYPSSVGLLQVGASSLGNYILSDGSYAASSSIFGSSDSWNQGWFSIGSIGFDYLKGTNTGWRGAWEDIDIGYLSLLFKDAEHQLHNAQIRILAPDDNPYQSMIIMDWSYTPNPIPQPSVSATDFLPAENKLHFSFSGLHSELEYILEESTNLVDGAWTTNNIFTAESDSYSTTNNISENTLFWRLKRR